jgi:hypothetical protein
VITCSPISPGKLLRQGSSTTIMTHVGEGLLMMGEIRSYTFPDPDYWVQNFYLKEVIRRFPHTPLAVRAWERMRDEITVNYSGSGGDLTPPSVVKMVETYRQLAEPQ